MEELSFVLLDDTEDEAQPPLVFQVLRKLQIKVTSRLSPLFSLPFTLPALQYFGLFSDPIVSSPAFRWHPITPAHDYLYHLLRNLRSLKLGYQCISNTMLINVLRLLPLLEVLVVDSVLQSYIGFLDGLTYRSQEESILPKLTNFSLYVDLDYSGRVRTEEEPTFPFTSSDFLAMVLSRAAPKIIDGVACLKQVYLCVETVEETHALKVDDIAMEFKTHKDLEGIAFFFDVAPNIEEVWTRFYDMALENVL